MLAREQSALPAMRSKLIHDHEFVTDSCRSCEAVVPMILPMEQVEDMLKRSFQK